jgi:hypothetical protein
MIQYPVLFTTGQARAAATVREDERPASFAVGALRLEQPLYWRGGTLSAEAGSSCEHVVPCADYWLSVVEPGDRLRVGFDRDDVQDGIRMELSDCATAGACTVRGETSPAYSAELFASRPARGMWRLRLTKLAPRLEPGRQIGSAARAPEVWRLRAKLERLSARGALEAGPVLPNLVAEPPFEVSFQDRFTGLNCLPDETVDSGPPVCLRVGFGPGNLGRGVLDVRFGPLHHEAGRLVGDITQLVRYDDPVRPPLRHAAGRYEYHVAHQHFHWLEYVTLELFAADGTRLVPRRTGRKLGFCLADVKIADWYSFAQEPADDDHVSETRQCLGPPRPGDKVDSWPVEARMRQTPGWTDIYDESTPGNYVDFSDDSGAPLPSGRYVIRTTVDPENHALEQSDTDNVGYTYIDVATREPITASTVTILERGRGLDPWDPDKTVLTSNQASSA